MHEQLLYEVTGVHEDKLSTNSNQHQLSAESLKSEAGRNLSWALSPSPPTTETDLFTTFLADAELLFLFHFVAAFCLQQDCYCTDPDSLHLSVVFSFLSTSCSQSLASGHVFQPSNHYCYSCCSVRQPFLRSSTQDWTCLWTQALLIWVQWKDLQDVLQVILLLIYLCSVFSLLRAITLVIYQNLQIIFFQTAFCPADVYPVFMHFTLA